MPLIPPPVTGGAGSVSLKTSSVTTAKSITLSGLDLNADEQYMIVARYTNNTDATSGTLNLRVTLNSDAGSNYSYSYQSYSNSGGGTRSDAAVNATTVFVLDANNSGETNGNTVIWLTKHGSNKAMLTWDGIGRGNTSTIVRTTNGGGYYNGSATVSTFQIGFMGASDGTKDWAVYCYKYSLT